jgi:hypothetical protein
MGMTHVSRVPDFLKRLKNLEIIPGFSYFDYFLKEFCKSKILPYHQFLFAFYLQIL